jgi:hypothetical protein
MIHTYLLFSIVETLDRQQIRNAPFVVFIGNNGSVLSMYHTSRIHQDDTSEIHIIHSHALSVAAVLKSSCSRDEMDDELHADDNYEEKRGVAGVASWNN